MSAGRILEARKIVMTLGEGAGQVMALKGVDLVLNGGELTLLMGPSGSGKTTLLSILGCILTPTEGSLEVVGHATAGLKAEELAEIRRKHIGFVFQSYNLFPTLTAEENVLLALDVRRTYNGTAGTEAKRVLEIVGLGHKFNSYPAQLSGGERQRVAIARAMAGNPSIILADEPTAALDGKNGQAIMGLLAEISRDPGRSVFVVTHDSRTLGFADRIVNIDDGLIVSDKRRERQYEEVQRL